MQSNRTDEEPWDVHRNYISAKANRRYRNHSIPSKERYSFLSSAPWLHFKRRSVPIIAIRVSYFRLNFFSVSLFSYASLPWDFSLAHKPNCKVRCWFIALVNLNTTHEYLHLNAAIQCKIGTQTTLTHLSVYCVTATERTKRNQTIMHIGKPRENKRKRFDAKTTANGTACSVCCAHNTCIHYCYVALWMNDNNNNCGAS